MIIVAALGVPISRGLLRWLFLHVESKLDGVDPFDDARTAARCLPVVVQVLLHRSDVEANRAVKAELERFASRALAAWRTAWKAGNAAERVQKTLRSTHITMRGDRSFPSRTAWAEFVKFAGDSMSRAATDAAAEALELGFPALMLEGFLKGGDEFRAKFEKSAVESSSDLEALSDFVSWDDVFKSDANSIQAEEELEVRPLGSVPKASTCAGRNLDILKLAAIVAGSPPRTAVVVHERGSGAASVVLHVLHSPPACKVFGRRRAYISLAGVQTVGALASRILNGLGLSIAGHQLEPLLNILSEGPCLLALDGVEEVLKCDPTSAAALKSLAEAATCIFVSRDSSAPLTVRSWPSLNMGPLGNPEAAALLGLRAGDHAVPKSPDGRWLLERTKGNALGIGLIGQNLRRGVKAADLKKAWARAEKKTSTAGPHVLAVLACSESLTSVQKEAVGLFALLPAGWVSDRISSLSLSEAEAEQLVAGGWIQVDEDSRRYHMATDLRDLVLAHIPASPSREANLSSLLGSWAQAGAQIEQIGRMDADRVLKREHLNVEAALRRMAASGAHGLDAAVEGYAEWTRFSNLGDPRLCEEVAAHISTRGDQRASARCSIAAAGVALTFGDQASAEKLAQSAFVLADQADDKALASLALRSLAESSSAKGRLDHAEKCLNEALALREEAQDPGVLAIIQRSLAEIASRKGKLAEAWQLLEAALESCREAGARRGEAECLRLLGEAALSRSHLKDADSRLDEAMEVFRSIGDDMGESECMRGKGDIALRRSEIESARHWYSRALPACQRAGNLLVEATCIKNVGNALLAGGDPDRAAEKFDEALAIYVQLRARLGQANCIRSLGDVAIRRAEFGKAKEAFETALPVFREFGAALGEANCVRSLGDLAVEAGDEEEALKLFEQALPQFRASGARVGEANCLGRIGDLALKAGDYARANQAFSAALPIYRESQIKTGEATCLVSLGDLALGWADLAEAENCYGIALELVRDLSDTLSEAKCLRSLGDVALRKSDHARAKTLLNEALAIYVQLQVPASIGFVHLRLAEISAGAERQQHLATSVSVWREAGLDNLVLEHLPKLAA